MNHPLNSVLHVSGVEAAAVFMLIFTIILTGLMIWDLSRLPYEVSEREFRGQEYLPPSTPIVFSNGLRGTFVRMQGSQALVRYPTPEGIMNESMDPRSFWMSLRSFNGRKVILPPYQD